MLKNLLILPDGTELFSGPGTDWAIGSVTVTECVNTGQELTLGSVCAAMLEATLIAPGLTLSAGDEVTLCKVDDSGSRTKAGLFTLEKPTRSGANTLKITAYDRAARLDKDLTQWLAALDGWPYGLYEFAERVCDACGLVLANDSLPNGDFPIWQFAAEGITGRQLMAWIGEAAGLFCRATADGLIEFAWYTPSGVSIGPEGDRFFYRGSLSYEDYAVAPIDKVQIQYSENDVGVIWPNDTEAANAYKITGNCLLITDTTDRLLPIAQTIYEALKDVTYTPCKVSIPACLDIHAGNSVAITDGAGNTMTALVMTKTQSGQRDTLECTGSARRDSVTAVNNQSYKALSGKVLNLQTSVEGVKAENADTAGKVSALSLDVDGITAQVSQQNSNIDGILEQLSAIAQTYNSVVIQIQSILDNGVDKVTTGTGYTFGDLGLLIEKLGQELKTLIDNTGMYITRSGELMLQVNSDGVIATDVNIRNYLMVGEHARFEDYGQGRTACFYT